VVNIHPTMGGKDRATIDTCWLMMPDLPCQSYSLEQS